MEEEFTTVRHMPRPAAVFGIDIGKNVFHVVGLDELVGRYSAYDAGATRCCSSSIGRRLPLSEWKPARDHNGARKL